MIGRQPGLKLPPENSAGYQGQEVSVRSPVIKNPGEISLKKVSKKGWRRRRESNPRIQVLQTRALPLGYSAFAGRIFRLAGDCCQHPLSSEMINFYCVTLKRMNS